MSETTWHKAIEKVLESASTALHYRDITDQIALRGFFKTLGVTPENTVSSTISSSIRNKGDASPYVRVSKGTYILRKKLSESNIVDSSNLDLNLGESQESDDQYEIISSFGMFWRKEAVKWAPTTKLLGVQQFGATPVDFYKQLGVYLLYDGREVIYVGRSTDGPLGKRLYDHTRDRLTTRWDRFSWFGVLPVIPDTGRIGSLPATYETAKLISALEAILIEALEPRQNRRRGDSLGVEYHQQADPDIIRSQIKSMMSKENK